MSDVEVVLAELATERKRQMEAEGWSIEHDDAHDAGQLAKAAAVYAWAAALNDAARQLLIENRQHFAIWRRLWPWSEKWWKPKDRRRDLIRAGALIIAEIERLDRARDKAEQERHA